ncbi:MAG: GNAT family N-acetyltransferase [Chloroflexota bacterium]
MIKHTQKPDLDTWWQIAKADPKATFYQTPAWLEVAKCMSDKYEDASFMGELESGVKFVFPLCSYSRQWPLKRVYSVYDQCYGGVITDGPITAAEHTAILQALPLTKFSTFDLTEVPGVRHGQFPTDYDIVEFNSSEIPLAGRTFEEIFSQYTRTHRTNYRKGAKSGLSIRQADVNNMSAEFDLFYEIYLETLNKRWGDDVQGDILQLDYLRKFEKVVTKYSNNFLMWFVELEGKAISVATAYLWNGRLDGWVMATRPEYFKLRPSTYVITELLQYAVGQGYKLFHFGPNGDNQGLADFKRRFGAVQVPYRMVHRPSPVLNLVDRVRN